MRFILPLTVSVIVCLVCVLSTAQEAQEEEELYMPRGVQHAQQTFQRDCPMCGWNPFKKRSSNKPAKGFEGAFKPGDTCPCCAGRGKMTDTIDWAGGFVVAYGVGIPKERSDAKEADRRKAQDFLMAKRAAQLRATRRAVELLADVRLNRAGKADSPTYKKSIEAFVKGAEHAEFKSGRDADMPYYIDKVKVPLWGVKGLSASLWAAYSKAYGARGHAAAPRPELEEEYIIVIDARGAECPPHLFPRVVTEGGTVVYDITLVNKETAQRNGMARFGYLKEDIPFEKLEETLKEAFLGATGSYAFWDDGETYAAFLDGDDDKPAEKPEDKPKKKRRKRKKIRVVKGKKAQDKKDASVVVSEADAKKMKDADKETDSLKGGKVIILTDSRVAGKEGRIIIFGPTRLACRK